MIAAIDNWIPELVAKAQTLKVSSGTEPGTAAPAAPRAGHGAAAWGWATWKRAWDTIDFDCADYIVLKKNK